MPENKKVHISKAAEGELTGKWAHFWTLEKERKRKFADPVTSMPALEGGTMRDDLVKTAERVDRKGDVLILYMPGGLVYEKNLKTGDLHLKMD